MTVMKQLLPASRVPGVAILPNEIPNYWQSDDEGGVKLLPEWKYSATSGVTEHPLPIASNSEPPRGPAIADVVHTKLRNKGIDR